MKILVTGGNGVVGQGIKKNVQKYENYENYDFVFVNSEDADLTDFKQTYNLFNIYNPDYVIHLAADVGGLFKNLTRKVEMFENNMKINMNVLKCSHLFKVKKLVSCLSTCIFPDQTSYPINEEMLHQGPPHHSNDGYAYAKRMLEVMTKNYREQYGCNFVCVIPTNVYGKQDNYNLENGHVIPSLIHKCFLAKQEQKEFFVKGTGKALRQFIYNKDLGKLILWTLFNYEQSESIILSVDEKDEVPIGRIATIIAKCFDYEEKLVFDQVSSDGQYKKTADNQKLRKYLPNFIFTDMEKGLQKTVRWFIQNYQRCRK